MSDGFKCLFCGGDLSWGSDSNASDVSAVHSEDDTAVVSYYTCMRCGRDYEIVEPPKEEREGQYKDYWNGKG